MANKPGRRNYGVSVDCVAIAALGVLVAAACFSIRQGRAVLSFDAIQYLDNAFALVNGTGADFACRKPGFSYLLAALLGASPTSLWPAVAVNYALLGSLPLAAYFLGRRLAGRSAGWIAAAVLVAQVPASLWGDRIMTEALFTALVSWGVVLLAWALSSAASRWVMFAAAFVLANAWLVRPVVVVVFAAGVVATLFIHRRQLVTAATTVAMLTFPVAMAFALECGLNYRHSGVFRPSTGTLGAMWLMRARHIEGIAWPTDGSGAYLCALIPERSPAATYAVNPTDVWIARYRAIREGGLSEWQIDKAMTAAGKAMLKEHPRLYLATAGKMFVRTLLRRSGGPPHSRVPMDAREGIVRHPFAPPGPDSIDGWYDLWALPHKEPVAALAFGTRMREAAATRAPFGRGWGWDQLRWLISSAPTGDVMWALRQFTVFGPGLALLLCRRLKLDARASGFLALVWVFDAALVALCGASDEANGRYQAAWVVCDSALAAALLGRLLFTRAGDAAMGEVPSGAVLREANATRETRASAVLELRSEPAAGVRT